MGDRQRHRGPHSDDVELFRESCLPVLQAAVSDLSWLLTREYAQPSALKLVGDRYQLRERQRTAVFRCSCADQSLVTRAAGQLSSERVAGRRVAIDGFNLITTIEAALAGGILIRGRDGCLRDMTSMHGTYRRVEETEPALQLIGMMLSELSIAGVHWLLDRPVSNSGRLAQRIQAVAAEHNWAWTTELHQNPDRQLVEREGLVVVSADSFVIEHCSEWLDLATLTVREKTSAAVLDLGRSADSRH